MQRAKITNTLLSILDELSPEQLEKVVTPTKSKFVAPPTASPDNNKMILYGVIGVLALGLLYFIFGSGGSTDATKPNGSSDLVTPPVNTTVTTSKPITTVTTVSSEKLSGDHSNEDNNGATLLKQNQELKKGVQNYTVDRKYYLIFQQDDGNVAIYKTDNNSFIWGMHNNKNAPLNAKFARMQDDGNFCLYDANNQFLWGTQTTVPGSTLGINQKGELVVLAPSGKEIWNGSK